MLPLFERYIIFLMLTKIPNLISLKLNAVVNQISLQEKLVWNILELALYDGGKLKWWLIKPWPTFMLLLHKMTVADQGKNSGKLLQVRNFKESKKIEIEMCFMLLLGFIRHLHYLPAYLSTNMGVVNTSICMAHRYLKLSSSHTKLN